MGIGLALLALTLTGTDFPPTDIRGDVPPEFRDAPAVVLLEQRSWTVVPMRRGTLRVTRRALIQDRRGLEEAEQEIVYWASDSDIEAFGARTVQLDGSVVPVPDELIHERLVLKTEDHELRALQFTFLQAQVGSILEVEYTVTEHDPPQFQRWAVQGGIPVLESRFRVSMKQPLQPWRVEISSRADSDEHCHVDEDEWSVRRIRYEMVCSAVPALRDEPSAPPERDTRLDFRVSTTPVSTQRIASLVWESIGRIYHRLTEGFLADSDAAAALGAELVDDSMTDERKLQTIYEYVRRELEFQTTYDVSDDPGSGVEAKSVDDVLERGGGNPFEITLLTLALLRGAGLEVRPMLANDRSRGRFLFDVPDRYSPTHSMLLVNIEDRSAVIDPSCRYCDAGVPDWRYCDQGTSALVIGRNGVVPIEVGLVPADRNVANHDERVVVRPGAGNSVTGSVTWGGHYDIDLRLRWEELSDSARVADFRRSLAGDIQGLEVRISDPKAPFEPLSAKYEYVRVDEHATSDGRILIRPPDPFTRALSIPIQEKRVQPLWFRYGFTVQARTVFQIPSGYALPDVPAAQGTVHGPGMTFQCSWRRTPGRHEIEWFGKLVLSRIRVEVDDYARTRDFVRSVRALLRRGVVLHPQPAERGSGG